MPGHKLTQRGDDGVAAVIMVLFSAVIVILLALVIDGGRVLTQHQGDQNGADAAALAAAVSCAKTGVPGDLTAYVTSGTPQPTTCNMTAGTVQVTVTQPVDYKLVSGSQPTSRLAIAQWDGVGSADTLPLTLSECDFQRITAGGMPTGTQTVYFHSETVNANPPFPCNPKSAAGLNLPGGFGWINGGPTTPPSNCITHVSLSTPSDQGNSPPTTCNKKADWNPLLNHDYLIAIYGTTDGHSYRITGFAEFTFQGYKWNGSLSGGTLDGKSCPDPVTGLPMANSVTCLQGSFKRIVTNGTHGGFNFGAVVVNLIK